MPVVVFDKSAEDGRIAAKFRGWRAPDMDGGSGATLLALEKAADFAMLLAFFVFLIVARIVGLITNARSSASLSPKRQTSQ